MDMWDAAPTGLHDFASLRQHISTFGLRHTMLTAQMPTASSSQILGHSEGVEPYIRSGLFSTLLTVLCSYAIGPTSSNIVQHRVLSGTFNELSRHLVTAVKARGLWSARLRDEILAAKGSRLLSFINTTFMTFTFTYLGSVKNISDVPDDLKLVFRTAFELDPQVVVDLALDRSPYIDQSQSMNLYIATPTTPVLVRTDTPVFYCSS